MMGYKGWRIPEGNVVQVTDASGVVIWAVQSEEPNKPIILEVEKITSDTYAGETTYTGEQFILLDIYPKTNGTVNVTYGGLTKTITDTSGAEEPNAQQVFFGTFNGVTDSTPASGELTIEGDYRGVGCGMYQSGSKSINRSMCSCVTAIKNFGNTQFIPNDAFQKCTKLTSVIFSRSIKRLGDGGIVLSGSGAFLGCTNLKTVIFHEDFEHIDDFSFDGCTALSDVTIPASVHSIGSNPFARTNKNNFLMVDSKNTMYKIDGNCLVKISNKTVISGFLDSIIPSYVGRIGSYAFQGCTGLTSITIPDSVKSIDLNAFASCTGLTSITIPSGVTSIGAYAFEYCTALTDIRMLPTTPPSLTSSLASGGLNSSCKITVPKGCGNAYKSAEVWSNYASIIVEAS